MTRLLLLVSVALMASCSADPTNGWHVTAERLRVPFEQATAEWCEISDGAYCPYLDGGSSQTVHDGSRDEHASSGDCGWFGRHPRLDGTRFEIGVNLSRVDSGECGRVDTDKDMMDALRAILAHELGHVAGLDHLPPGQGVMSNPAESHVTYNDASLLLE